MREIFGTTFFLVGLLTLLTNEAIANRSNPPWARDFRGQLTFDLTDEAEYRQALGRLNELQTQIGALQVQIDRLVDGLKKEEAKRVSLTQLVEGHSTRLQALQAEMVAAQNRINEISGKVPGINQLIETKKRELLGKEKKLTLLNPQIIQVGEQLELAKVEHKNAQLAYRQVLTACQQTGAANCEQSPKVVEAKAKVDEALSKQNAIQIGVNTLNIEKTKLVTEITALKNEISSNESQIIALNQESTRLTARLSSGRTELQNIRTQLETLTPQLQQVMQNIANLNQNLSDRRSELTRLSPMLAQRQRDFDIFEHNLIRAVLDANHRGFQAGERDGKIEGVLIAERLGRREGERQGRAAGLHAGEEAGRDRDYKRGYAEGDSNGASRAYDEAKEVGTREGNSTANREIGLSEGRAEGLRRAEASDAKIVGEREGKVAGLNRAKETGKREGRRIGEGEAIQQNEQRELRSVIVNGQFAGTFNNQVPVFPGATRERYQIPGISTGYNIVRLSIKAGYDEGFFVNVERSYYEAIDKYFREAFRVAESAAYNEAYNRTYQDSFNQGRIDGDKAGYARTYPQYYQEFFSAAYQATLKSPNRNSNDYKNAFQTANANAYAQRYQEIYQQVFNQFEATVFRDNIAAQTESNRQARIVEVNDVYTKNPVLKFISSNLVDRGVSGVGSEDGIFAPGESLVHSVVIRNLGRKAATNVKVILGGNRVYAISEVPALSETTFKDVALESVPMELDEGSKYTSKLSVKLEGEVSDGLLTRHFSRPDLKLLVENNQKNLDIKYPVTIGNFALNSPLVLAQELTGEVILTNRSQKKFTGPVKIELQSSLGQSVVTTDFPGLEELQGIRKVNGAKIKVEDESLVFSYLNLKAIVKVKDVVVGKTENLFSESIKFGFLPTLNKKVVVYDSLNGAQVEKARELLQVVGGIKKLSIVDLNPIFSNHRQVLERNLEGYTIFLLADEANVINGALKNKNVLALKAKEQLAGKTLEDLKNSLPVAKGSIISYLKIKGNATYLLTLNPYVNTELKSKNTLAEVSNLNDLVRIEFLENLKKSNDEQLTLVKSVMKKENALNPSEAEKMLVSAIIHNILTDIGLHQKGFELSDEDGDWARRLDENESLMGKKMAFLLSEGSATDKLPLSMIALGVHYAVDHSLDEITPFKDAHRKVLRLARKSINSLPADAKKFFRRDLRDMDLFDALKDKEAMYLPF